jgi:hypothetical protein
LQRTVRVDEQRLSVRRSTECRSPGERKPRDANHALRTRLVWNRDQHNSVASTRAAPACRTRLGRRGAAARARTRIRADAQRQFAERCIGFLAARSSLASTHRHQIAPARVSAQCIALRLIAWLASLRTGALGPELGDIAGRTSPRVSWARLADVSVADVDHADGSAAGSERTRTILAVGHARALWTAHDRIEKQRRAPSAVRRVSKRCLDGRKCVLQRRVIRKRAQPSTLTSAIPCQSARYRHAARSSPVSVKNQCAPTAGSG